MPTQKSTIQRARFLRLCTVMSLCAVSAFAVGLRTSGNVEPIEPIQANELMILRGDMNNDGRVTEADAAIALELSEHYRKPTVNELKVDPNRDGTITVQDALTILNIVDSSH